MWTYKSMLRTLLLCLAFTLSGISISCNTMEGAGKDVERGGEKIQDAAQDAKH